MNTYNTTNARNTIRTLKINTACGNQRLQKLHYTWDISVALSHTLFLDNRNRKHGNTLLGLHPSASPYKKDTLVFLCTRGSLPLVSHPYQKPFLSSSAVQLSSSI